MNLPDSLFHAARAVARRDGVKFEELLELAVRREIERREREARTPFRLRKFSVEGDGVRSSVLEGRWFDSTYPARGESQES